MLSIDVPSGGALLPSWSHAQRRLIDALSEAAEIYLDRYVDEDGGLMWGEVFLGRDGLDDAYEAYWNWPLATALGASPRLLARAERGWEGVTAQFRAYGQVDGEYERGYDWFHQGEGNMLLYGILDAGSGRARWRERVREFADLFVDPHHGNWDARTGFFRSPHVGSAGARFGPYRFSAPFTDDVAYYGWSERHRSYGLPLHDVAGVPSFESLKEADSAQRMGLAMNERMLKGDTAISLISTGLIVRAFLETGDRRYRDWVLAYVDRWRALAAHNDGIVPDNVGLSGTVGEYHAGRWYGGHYGWQWPHGLEPIASALFVAGSAAWLLTGGTDRMDALRGVLDAVLERARVTESGLVVPHRYGPAGWFDEQPFPTRLAAGLWLLTQEAGDRARLDLVLRHESSALRRGPGRFGTSNLAGWMRYLRGEQEDYPDRMLAESLAEVAWRVEQIRADDSDLATVHLHHWQMLNPVVVEALIELTCGGPVPVYNGGLTLTRLAYLDAASGRRGLPDDVSALVTSIDRDEVHVELVNTAVARARTVEIVGGFYDEHALGAVTVETATAEAYPGPPRYDGRPAAGWTSAAYDAEGEPINVRLGPGARARLRIHTSLRARGRSGTA